LEGDGWGLPLRGASTASDKLLERLRDRSDVLVCVLPDLGSMSFDAEAGVNSLGREGRKLEGKKVSFAPMKDLSVVVSSRRMHIKRYPHVQLIRSIIPSK
jgi:hypothetical protein